MRLTSGRGSGKNPDSSFFRDSTKSRRHGELKSSGDDEDDNDDDDDVSDEAHPDILEEGIP